MDVFRKIKLEMLVAKNFMSVIPKKKKEDTFATKLRRSFKNIYSDNS